MKRILIGSFTLAIIATVSTIAAARTECNGTISSPVSGGLVVKTGDNCIVQGTTVNGGIQMSGGILEVCASTINGAVKATGGTCVFLGESSFGCDGNSLNGHVSIANVTGGAACSGEEHESVELEGDDVNGGAALDNNGIVEVPGNTFNGTLDCENNTSVNNDGSPNTVTGQEKGQCSGL